jgi:hypothetical protein
LQGKAGKMKCKKLARIIRQRLTLEHTGWESQAATTYFPNAPFVLRVKQTAYNI